MPNAREGFSGLRAVRFTGQRLCYLVLFLLLLCVGQPLVVTAQVTPVDRSLGAEWRRAREYWGAENYATAEALYLQIEREALLRGDAITACEGAYWHAMCAVRLGREDAPARLIAFLDRYPGSIRESSAHLALGSWYYDRKEWDQVLAYMPKTDAESLAGLSNEEQMEVRFKRGYALFMKEEYTAARGLLGRVKGSGTYYEKPAQYYYAHIAYQEGLYRQALQEFDKLEGDETFGALVPFYKGQIYYLRGDYQGVVDYVGGKIDSLSGKRRVELQRLLADSHFRLGNWSAAKGPLEAYLAGTASLSREDEYLAGFIYYRLGEYDKAIAHMERVVTGEDALTQNANYVLGDCYLKGGDRNRAQSALRMASRVNYDTLVQEDAFFSYACLTLEGPGSPFEDAVEVFTEYLELFPWSERRDLAYSYLGTAFVETRNYERALEVLGRIESSNSVVRHAMQRAAYYRGVELYLNRHWAQALDLFCTSLEFEEQDARLRALALYWRGEVYYQLGRYALALKDWRDFRRSAGAFSQSAEFAQSEYGMGYAYYRMGDYREASKYLRSYAENETHPAQMRLDAYNRAGDCLFLLSNYWGAVEFYESAAALNLTGSDYALYQSGFSLGLLNRNAQKAARLQTLLHLWPQSALRGDAYYALAELYHNQDSLALAKMYYTRVVEDYPSSSRAGSALLQLGLVSYAEGDFSHAKGYLERVVSDYGDGQQRSEALTALERVYQSEGNIDGYIKYLDKSGFETQLSAMHRDSLYFSSAESQYMQGNWERARDLLEAYLRDYPRGVGSPAAHFYLGDTHLQLGDTARAVGYLEEVVERGITDYQGRSLKVLAPVMERGGVYEKGLKYYDRLAVESGDREVRREARLGGLRCAVGLGQDSIIRREARLLLNTEGLQETERHFALYQMGSVHYRAGRYDEAYSHFQQMGDDTRTPSGSEAFYRRVEISYRMGLYERARSEAMAFAKHRSPHQDWLARAFIILGQVYAQEDDYFQAKATLQSIIDNYRSPSGEDDGVKAEAQRILEELTEQEERSRSVRDPRDTIVFRFQE